MAISKLEARHTLTSEVFQQVPGPTFFVLGAAKSGTTSLCAALARHPEVFISSPKEPVFFEREYALGLDYYRKEYFSKWAGEKAIGEGRVYHLYLPFVPPRIHHHFPQARLIAILRDPIARAHSHWWHRFSRGYDRRTFEEAVEEELAELQFGHRFAAARDPKIWERNFFSGTRGVHADVREVRYLEMGHYHEQIARYREIFSPDQLQVLRFEEFVRKPESRLREVWEFLGVGGDGIEPRLAAKNIAEESVKTPAAFALERAAWKLGLQRVVPKRWRTRLRKLLSRENAIRPALSRTTRDALAHHYDPHNRALVELLRWKPDVWSSSSL